MVVRSVGNSFEIAGIVVARQEAGRSSAVLHMDAERLHVAAGDIRAVGTGGFQEAQADRVDPSHEEGPRFVRQPPDLEHLGLQDAQVRRLFHVHRRHAVRELCAQIGQIETAGGRIVLTGVIVKTVRAKLTSCERFSSERQLGTRTSNRSVSLLAISSAVESAVLAS